MNPSSDQGHYSWSIICGENFRHAGLVAALLGIPFLGGSLATGIDLPDLLAAGLILLVLADAGWAGLRGRHLLNRTILLALAGATLCWLMFDAGPAVQLLAVPLIFGFHFMLDGRPAVALNVALLAGLLPSLLLQPAALDAVPTEAILLSSSVMAWFFATVVRQRLQTLEEQVATDALTGAYNRRRLNARLAEKVEIRKRHGRPASLIVFDVDHFKHINDQFGHEVGDRVLRILVDTVKARVRLTDEVFRFGGEEFVILLPDTQIDPALKLAQDITEMIAAIRLIEGGPISISCGVGELKTEESATDWVKRCDVALYNAKHQGRGRACRAPDHLADPDVTVPQPIDRSTVSKAG